MPSVRPMPQALIHPEGASFHTAVFAPDTNGLLAGVARLAREYPFPHSILGSPKADTYVRGLAARTCHAGEGWYGLGITPESLAAAAFLSIYGFGRGDGHTLWKIRHPLVDGTHDDGSLVALFEALVASAVRARPGTAKFVVFFGEHEQPAMRCAERSGFECEACFPDYYRLGEKCFVYGRTVR